jgi:hypothetical protein
MENLDELHEEVIAHRNSTAFDRLKEYNLAKLKGYRDRLEKLTTLDEILKLQGRIKECRDQLELLSE